MSRGLSKQQLRILGLATAVNRFTNGGEATVKTGPALTEKGQFHWRKLIQYPGVADINYTLAAHWVYGIPFGGSREVVRNQKLRDGTNERQQYTMRLGNSLMNHESYGVKSASLAVKRSFKSLISRGLMVQTNGWDFRVYDERGLSWWHEYHWGSVLTKPGLEIGLQHEERPDDLLEIGHMLRFGHVLKTFHIREVLNDPSVDDEKKQIMLQSLRFAGIVMEDRG